MNSVGRFFRDLLVGTPIVFLGTALISGGFDEAVALLLISVICTFGVGLLFWIPVCWFVGWLLMKALSAASEPRLSR